MTAPKFAIKLQFSVRDINNQPLLLSRGKVLESARENSKISSCFVLWEPWNWEYSKKSDCIWFSQARTPHTYFFLSKGSRVSVEMGTKSEKVCMYVCVWRFFVDVYFTLHLEGPKSLLAQIWYGDFYIWGIDAIKFLWKSGEGVGG